MTNHLKSGIFFSALGVYSNFILQIVIQMILSRLLTPRQYGVVAIMTVFIIFFQVMIEAGMGPAIIQNKTLNTQDYRILFDFSAIFALIMAVLFGLFGNILASIYHNPIYSTLTWIQSISVFFNGLNVVPTAVLNKKKQFKATNFSLVLANLLAGVVGITTAFLGVGVYSLIFSVITSSVINVLLNRFFSNIWFTSKISIKPLKRISSFSINQFTNNFINYFSRNADNLVVGKMMGAVELGNYSKAYQLLMMPNTLLISVINPVLQPVLSDYQDNIEYIRDTYYQIIHFLLLIGIPLSIFLSTTAHQIIFVLFGNQWEKAVFPFSILSMTVWLQLIYSPTVPIFLSRNHSRQLLSSGLIAYTGMVFLIIIGGFTASINTMSIFVGIGFIWEVAITYYILITRTIHGRVKELMKQFANPVLLGIVVFWALLLENFFDSKNVFISLIIRGFVFLACYIGFVWLTPEKKIFLKIIRK